MVVTPFRNYVAVMIDKRAATSENVPTGVRTEKIQISMRIHAFSSESSLGAFLTAKDAKFLYEDNEGYD